MAKGFTKFLFKTALVGAAAYGAYYYLRKEEVLTPVVDEEDNSENCEEDLDGEPTKARSYINLTFDKAKAEDLAKNAVKKARITINDSVQKVEEFFNDEMTEENEEDDETAKEASEVVTETIVSEPVDETEATDDPAKANVEADAEAKDPIAEAINDAMKAQAE